jgi:NAD(P)H-flavin reductase/hemoglobin-like flavoprotein
MVSLSQVLKESWAHVESQQEALVAHFYARLFLARPDLRELFPIQMRAQGRRLLLSIVRGIQTVDDPDEEYFLELGRHHRRYEVSAEHHEVFRECLVAAVRTYSGADWDAERERAWRDGYDVLARRMRAGADAEVRAGLPRYWFAEVLSHQRRTPDIAVFSCKPFPRPLPFRPGQYVYLDTSHEPRQWRPYSIANAPRPDGTLDFHVRALSCGTVSTALVWKLRVGDVLRLSAPAGALALPMVPGREVVCVAGGTGLAPVKALVDAAGRAQHTPWVHLYCGARTADELYDLPALEALAARQPWLRLVPAVSGQPEFRGEQGQIGEVMARHGPWQDHEFLVCGPPAMMRATLDRLAQLQIPPSRVHYDPFGAI